ncbi:sensor histidine kinase [Leptolyngbya sp. NIES-2104]|uniref:sensor histidine kinase n=1 Tax=Leptolyngbya sp. NIES-2104 TaxID=1552121 RepID=UPI0006EC4B3D|nr:sensor histidine kinase [Leptolyngbya sp. NIES-2104]GAP94103.1 signal transduction histidine kinase [Leptolyngbya sp. NIES-2104]
MLNPVMDFSPTFRRTLRYIEWLLIAAFFVVYGLDALYSGSWAEFLKIVAYAIGFIGLSQILPIDRPPWQRQIYLLSGLFLAMSIRLIGLEWDLLFYFYIAKSCFLLERRMLSITIVESMLLNILLYYYTLLQRFVSNSSTTLNLSNSQPIWRWLLEFVVTYAAILTFVVYLSLVVITEQKSRRRAEALTQQVETLAATLERTRIARDIHDSLGHLLTDLNARLSVAQAMRDRDPQEAAIAVDMAKLLAIQSMTEVKRSLQIIRQSDFDLTQALTTLMEQLRHNQNLSVRWNLNLPPLPLPTQHHLYCIVKEGLINIQKHSHASEAYLNSRFTTEELTLALSDNGQGFDVAEQQAGFGLKGMTERVQLLSGHLTIHSTIGLGTQIQITIPL